MSCVNSQIVLFDGSQPAIFQVSPNIGGLIGGTNIKIYGANFQPSGLFSNLVVYIGNDLCEINNYYTTNEQIYCVTPPCATDDCLNQSPGYSAWVSVDISLFVETVEGILGAYSTYYYSSYYTPTISYVSTFTWASSIGSINTNVYTDSLDKFTIKINNHFVNLGTNDELNYDDFNWYNWQTNTIYFIPPGDMTAGFYNLTMQLTNSDSLTETLSTGYAKTYPDDSSENIYSSTLSGVAYSTAVYPVITNIYPNSGSLAGGTTITIKGSGFSTSSELLTVLVGGKSCKVISSSINTIVCITDEVDSIDSIKQSIISNPHFERYKYSNVSTGSPGMWIKFWDYNDNVYHRTGNIAYVKMSFAWRQGSTFSLSDNYGLSWPSTFNFNSDTSYNQYFYAEVGTVLIAPISGYYTIYARVDDNLILYGSLEGMGINEKVINYVPYYTTYSTSFNIFSGQISSPIYLVDGQKMYLRGVWTNAGLSSDALYLSLKIQLPENISSTLNPTCYPTNLPSSKIDLLTLNQRILKDINSSDYSNLPTLPCYYKNFPDTFMRYYSVREIQQIKFSFSYYYEIQEIRFNNVVSEALNYAASIIPSNKVQCQSFGVQTSWKGSTYSIYVSFIVDNSYNASFLQILDYTAEQSLSYSIFRKQSHSRLPSGSFNLIVNSIYIKSIPFSVSDQQLRYLINSADSKNDVLVSYSGGYYTGQTWLITFVRPRGNIPKVIIDSSKITGENFNVNITTVTQGSLSTLFFDTIPLWMLEIPLSWATNNKTTSTVEVYQTVSSSNSTIGNDTMKAICDNSGTSYDTTFGLLKGNETTCAYQYLISMTPVVNDFNITNTTTKYSYFPTYNVIIIGSGFLLANLSSNVIVTIGPAICNITGLSDNEINCSLTAVSYGTYTVNVTIIGIGSAVLFTNKTVTFDMMILNIIPVYGSLAGGQLVTISGSIVCKLSRNLTSLAAANVNAYIYIPDKGYAATLDNYQVTPKVDYGFEIYSVSPLYGSIYGGTNLSINGFGFASNESSLNVVTLSDTIGSDSYTILVKALAGDYQPTVLISELGYAKVNANVTILVELDIQSINFSNTIGSVGGGVIFTVNGFGFDSICENMNISFVLESISSQTLQNIQVTYYFKCSYYHVVGYMPPIPVLFTVSNFTVNVVKLEIEVHGKTANISSLQLFQYSTTVTPIIYSYQNQKSVFDNNTEFLVYVPLSNIKSTQFETTRFGIYRGYCNQTSLMGSLASTNISINCITPTIAAGLYTVYVEIFPYGYALLKSSSGHLYLPTYQSVLLVDEFITTEYSSIAGGKHLKITGEGMSSNLTVTVCEINCPIVASSYNRVICEVPAYRTTDFVDYIDSLGITIDMIETVDTSIASISTGYGSYSYNMKYAFDQLYTTYYSHYTYGCYVGIKMTGNNRIQPYRMRFYPAYQAASSISDISFEGSLDGGISYITLDSIDSANEGWNFLSSNSTLWFTHLRYKAYDSSYCRVAELKFLGVVASYSSNCNVDIQSSDSVFHVGNISYSENNIQTAKILSVSPLNGTSLGGTIVTLTGLFNSLNDTNIFPNVTINGINCSVTSYSIGSISCISGYRGQDNIQTRKLSVFIPNYGYAVSGDDVYYIYMDKWSELTTWKNQNLPVDGDFVWIPDGQSIVLDVDTPLLEFLLIQGELYFDNTKPSINLDAYYVFVYGGLLQIGTELQPYENNVTITIYGDRYKNIDIPEIGYKCIAVASLGLPKESQTSGFHLPGKDQGQLEIHGQKRLRTWTKLAKTAYAGSSIILTSEPVDFKAGDILVLSGTEVQSNEDFSIDIATVAENLDNHNITLTDPLRYTHRSEIVVVSGRTVDLRGEVGLLSRNIIIQGDDQSQGQLFGVHMVARMSGIFRVENAEIRRCGQGFLLGRYCTHSHKAGNMEGSYVKANSIHNSFQRAVTTHDTFYWEVRDNVAYNVLGHTFFVEDGTEKYNTISGNLGIRTKLSSASLSSDQKPAVFWTSGPTNFWYDNVGSNSDSFGFWFELGEHPNNFLADGDYDVCPVHEKLGEFRNNTVRGNAMIGLRIYPEYTPLQDPCDSNSDPSPQYLYDLVSYRNGQGLFSKRHGDLHHIGYSLIENAGNGISIVKYQHVNYTTDPAISNAVIVGSLDGNFDLSTNFGYVAVWLPQNEYFFISDINIINYGVSGAFSGCNECDSGEMFAQGGITTRFLNMKFSNTSRKILWTPHYKEIFWDLDGSLLNINGGGMVTYFYSFNLWTANCFQPDISIYDYSIICNNTSYIRRMTLDAFTPSSLAYYSLTITSAIGFDFIPFLPRDIYGWVFPIVENQSYQFSWSIAETSASRFSLNFAHSPYLKESYALGRNESIQINYQPYSWDYIPVDFVNTFYDKSFWVSTNKTVSLLGRMGDSYYNTNISKLSMIISTDGADFDYPWNEEGYDHVCYISTSARLCPQSGCYVPPTQDVHHLQYWSKNSTWIGHGGSLPSAGSSFNISSTQWIVLDISPPPLDTLVVYGKLSFLSGSNTEITLRVRNLQVFGTLEINGHVTVNGTRNVTDPYIGNATIVIYGTKSQSSPVVLGEGLFIGSKVIAVAGSMIAKGLTTADSYVKLNQTALKGSNTIYVTTVSQLGWTDGDEIVISTTSYFSDTGSVWSNSSSPNNEIRRITAIKNYDGIAVITVDYPLQNTHACYERAGVSFCGVVGLLSRNIRIISEDISAGFGGHIAVVDILSTSVDGASYFIGNISFDNVQFINIGKLNTDYYGIGINYRQIYDATYSNSIINCAFKNSYNYAIYTSYTSNITINNNIIAGVFGGGVFIDETCSNVIVTNNAVLGLQQFPGIYQNGYAWVVPIASFTFNSLYGYYASNLAAGSVDTGFSVATSVFSGYSAGSVVSTLFDSISDISPCTNTYGSQAYFDLSNVLENSVFVTNEAVGCKVGLMVVVNSADESESSTCAVVSGMISWRNSHIGIGGVDAIANTLLHQVVVAENHIGISFSYFRSDDDVYSGVIDSIIIGSLRDNLSTCNDSTTSFYDSNWGIQKCQVFSEYDPFGQSIECNSVLRESIYNRVGILMTQSTNAAKTCRLANTFASGTCDPSLTPDRLCSLPWEKRYGLPSGNLYSELHIHNNTFSGFSGDQSCESVFGVAVGLNPSQIDLNPVIVSSDSTWLDQDKGNMDISARLGLFISPEYTCANDDCMGHKMLLIHDYRSFLKDTADNLLSSVTDRENVQGQIVYNNPEYVGSSAVCTEASALGDSLYSCLSVISPKSKSSSDFKEYTGLWQDYEEAGDNVVIGPITVYRYSTYDLFNERSYSSYSAKRDPCPDIDPSNRFPLLIASGYYHHLLPAGQLPTSWFIRWDAPSENDSAVLDFYIQGSYVMNVFVGPSEDEITMRHISSMDSTPGLFDKAGSNGRNPQTRNLTLTVRGGENNRYYLLRQLPTIQVTIKMEMNLSMFFSDTFVANIATLLHIPITRIKIASVRKGSVIVDFQVYPNVTVVQTHSDLVAQIVELQQVANNFTTVVSNGALEKLLNVTISRLSLQPPTIPTTDATTNSSATVSSSFDSSPILLIGTQYPTSAPTVKTTPFPTNFPSKKPSSTPTNVPTRSPTVYPSPIQSITPTLLPTLSPTLSPTNSPTNSLSGETVQPTVYLTYIPTSSPSEIPTDAPSTTPTNAPIVINQTSHITSNPSNFPTLSPTVQIGASVPINPTSSPSISPTSLTTSISNTSSSKSSKSKSSATVIIATSVTAAFIFIIGVVFYYIRSTKINKIASSNGFQLNNNRNNYLLESGNA
eukprot:gene18019-23659_t